MENDPSNIKELACALGVPRFPEDLSHETAGIIDLCLP